MLSLFNNEIFKHSFKYLLIISMCFILGFIYGKYTEKLDQAKLALHSATQVTRNIEAHQVIVNKILAEKENKLTEIARTNAILKERLIKNEKVINNTNVIRHNFVRHVSATHNTVPQTTSTVNATDESSSDLGRVSASRVGNYIIDLKTHDDTCVLQLNSLIKAIQ